MNLANVIRERIRGNVAGLELDADVNAVVATNVGERGQTTEFSSRSTASAGLRAAENARNANPH